jgi:membrane associated rhomboid family serine protease
MGVYYSYFDFPRLTPLVVLSPEAIHEINFRKSEVLAQSIFNQIYTVSTLIVFFVLFLYILINGYDYNIDVTDFELNCYYVVNNGEWWRLVTSLFFFESIFHLLAIAFIQVLHI